MSVIVPEPRVGFSGVNQQLGKVTNDLKDPDTAVNISSHQTPEQKELKQKLKLLKCLWSSLTYFSFNDAPNVLYR